VKDSIGDPAWQIIHDVGCLSKMPGFRDLATPSEAAKILKLEQALLFIEIPRSGSLRRRGGSFSHRPIPGGKVG
jgi:hypothetical protein